MSHIEALAADIGIRKEGTEAEAAGAQYAADYLEGLGYTVEVTDVPLPNGLVSHNVRAVKEGASPMVVVVGGHLDSKSTSPGANDNASGCALVLELARDFRDADVQATLEFVLFGAEEITGNDSSQHHHGSRRYVATMSEDQRSALVGMISADLVAYGDELLVRTMGRGPSLLADMLLAFSADAGIASRYEQDPGSSGWSDHEAFELAGYPVAWLEWQDDPAYHTAGDTFEHCDPQVLGQTGRMLRDFLLGLTGEDLSQLADARESD
jgi:Zn-dependent M28 family amino/carboxypeptidase